MLRVRVRFNVWVTARCRFCIRLRCGLGLCLGVGAGEM